MILSEVIASAQGRDGGVRLVIGDQIRRPKVATRITDEVARLGYVCVRPREALQSGRLRTLLHRHLTVIVDRPEEHACAIVLVRGLARASPRRHVVVWSGLWQSPSLGEATPDLPWIDYVKSVARRVDTAIAAGEFAEAAAWLNSVETEGTLRREALPDVIRDRRARLDTPERTNMLSVEELGRLLRLLEDAPDEASALSAGCAWVRGHVEEVSVGVVSPDGLKLFAAHGWKPADVAGAIAGILRGPDRDLKYAGARQPTAGFGVSVRYGTSNVAHVVVGVGGGRPSELLQAVQALAMLIGPAARACLDALDAGARERDGLREILGRSQAVADVRTAIGRAAATSFPVLVEGASGTGKELVARAVHRLSARRDRRFLAVNCAALTDELVESELFGHARGAFTGAIGPRAGLFEDAHGGTLFLDEVTELSPRAQAKLLRVLQEREIRRVGESATRSVDVRIVAATNLPLADAVAQGKFRDDLRFRLAVVPIRLPPLRDRLEDLPQLAHVLWRRALAETGKRAFLGPDALVRLTRHQWPGNVRELQNVVAGLAVIAPTCGRVTGRHVSQVLEHVAGSAPDESAPALPLDAARKVFERRMVASTLARHAGRRSAAAQDLGLTRQGLAKAMRRLGLPRDEKADEDAAGVA